jgi:hypothetical protein
MSEPKPNLIKCLMCYGVDAETQERLKDRVPVEDCHLCAGTGKIEVEFKAGFDSNELQTTGRRGNSGYPLVYLPEPQERKLSPDEQLTVDQFRKLEDTFAGYQADKGGDSLTYEDLYKIALGLLADIRARLIRLEIKAGLREGK